MSENTNLGLDTTGIFKNYYKLLNNNNYNLKKPETVLEILTDDAKYNWFISSLMEGMNQDQINVGSLICDAQRTFLIEELATNIANAETTFGYAVSYFPILCDTYCTDILGQAILYKTIEKPIITIPRLKVQATVNNSDGTQTSWTFPRAMFLIRSKPEKFEIAPAGTHSLFALSQSYPNEVNETISLINKRYFVLESLKIEVANNKTGEKSEINHSLYIRADARNQLHQEFELISDKDPSITANCTLIGYINFDNGRLQFNMTSVSSNPNYSFKLISGTFSCLFTSKTSDIGRVKVSVKMSGNDLNVAVNEDFEYELDVETLQEYKDIYNIDLVKTMSMAIKAQILLNRDHDIAQLLISAIPDTKINHTYEQLQFKPIFDTDGYLSPGYYSAIFQNIIPKFSLIARYMYYNTNLVPSYILCGIKTSALIESLQEFSFSIPDMRTGLGGYNNAYGDKSVNKYSFRRYNILMSHAIPDNMLFLTYKPQSVEEEHYSNLVNFIYKPLYLVEEITNSEKRVYIRTRNTVELLNTSTIGFLELPDINAAMTTYEYQPKKLNWF